MTIMYGTLRKELKELNELEVGLTHRDKWFVRAMYRQLQDGRTQFADRHVTNLHRIWNSKFHPFRHKLS